jgi:hypothetical protein
MAATTQPEPAWELANKQINGDYGVKQLCGACGRINAHRDQGVSRWIAH